MELVDRVLEKLSGAEFWIAVIAAAIGIVGWFYLGHSKDERSTARRQILFVLAIAVLAMCTIEIRNRIISSELVFSEDVVGILVARISGDTPDNSLQRDLVSALGTELSLSCIFVHSHNELITEDLGLAEGHARARRIGRECRAFLVVWGERVEKEKFHPRITVIVDRTEVIMPDDQALIVQDLNSIELPPLFLNNLVFLARFVSGLDAYHKGNFAKSLSKFEDAMKRDPLDSGHINYARFYTGVSKMQLACRSLQADSLLHSSLTDLSLVLRFLENIEARPIERALVQGNMGIVYASLPSGDRAANLVRAIDLYNTAIDLYPKEGTENVLAAMRGNLANAFVDLPKGDRITNLRRAIAIYREVLTTFGKLDSAAQRAITSNNLGTAYAEIMNKDHFADLDSAISAFKTALEICRSINNPELLATIHVNLANAQSQFAYWQKGTNDGGKKLSDAFALYDSAIKVFREDTFPVQWALIQNDLGIAYGILSTGNKLANLEKAVSSDSNAFRVLRKKNFSFHWALTQVNLGDAYRQLFETSNSTDFFSKCVGAYDSSLTIFTEASDPDGWSKVQYRLGDMYSRIAPGSVVANLQIGIGAYLNALRVVGTEEDRSRWAQIQSDLGEAYFKLSNYLNNDQNLTKAIVAFDSALMVNSFIHSPVEWAILQLNRGAALSEMTAGNRIQNLQIAIQYTDSALTILTFAAYPELHQMAIRNRLRNLSRISSLQIGIE